jgi:hypothetical protein
MDRFIRRKNQEHYRQLLEQGQLDEAQQQMVLNLLAEEEDKTGHIELPTDIGRPSASRSP